MYLNFSLTLLPLPRRLDGSKRVLEGGFFIPNVLSSYQLWKILELRWSSPLLIISLSSSSLTVNVLLFYRYITDKPQHWKETFALNCMDCAPDTGRLKLVLGLSHTMNYHNIGEKTSRRSELILEMKKLFQEYKIEYHLPPQERHLKSIAGTTINLTRSP